ncbi:hypothetical protein XENOCAPTIV_011035, partial [Xenoophorus captivus]
NVPPDLAICTFILEQSLSVRALVEMLANTVEMTEENEVVPDDEQQDWNSLTRSLAERPTCFRQERMRKLDTHRARDGLASPYPRKTSANPNWG